MSHREPATVDDAAIGTAESPALGALVQRGTTAYLRSALYSEDHGWAQVRTDMQDDPDPLARLESR